MLGANRSMLTDMFRKAKSSSILLDGRRVLLYDTVIVPERGKLAIVFRRAESEWSQGVWIGHMVAGSDLRLTVDGDVLPAVRLWEAAAPDRIEIAFSAPQKLINVYNFWDPGMGHPLSQLMGAGMLCDVSDDGNTRHYRCNDGHAETTFSHLEFSLELIA